ncbi:MAG TPA: TadE/TadG family type IV pilus assembly protein [Blastocatellia bacterium]|nr:TadE/TadG family type IV pilus assembly protein [Blastocatellia bacterium]
MSLNVVRKIRRSNRQERGLQLVETCLVLPILLVLLAGATEFASYFYTYATLSYAVRAGARHACKWQIAASWTIPETKKFVVYGDVSDTSKGAVLPGLTESQVSVTANGPSANKIDSVTVKIINYQYQPVFDLAKLTGISALSLKVYMSPSVTMKQLFNGPVNGNLGS